MICVMHTIIYREWKPILIKSSVEDDLCDAQNNIQGMETHVVCIVARTYSPKHGTTTTVGITVWFEINNRLLLQLQRQWALKSKVLSCHRYVIHTLRSHGLRNQHSYSGPSPLKSVRNPRFKDYAQRTWVVTINGAIESYRNAASLFWRR